MCHRAVQPFWFSFTSWTEFAIKIHMCLWVGVHIQTGPMYAQSTKTRRIPSHCSDTLCHSIFPGKGPRWNTNIGLWINSFTAFIKRLLLIFAKVHIKNNDWREGKSPLTFGTLHEMVEESLPGLHRKRSFENYMKCRKRTGEQKDKHQNSSLTGDIKRWMSWDHIWQMIFFLVLMWSKVELA